MLNEVQTALSLLQPKEEYLVCGRAWGKSFYLGNKINQVIQTLPGSNNIIFAKSHTHILSSILPTAFESLRQLGYHRDINYVIGVRPPLDWKLPYITPIRSFDNYITFFNKKRCVGFQIVSQEGASARGQNSDYLLTDETLLLSRQKMTEEVIQTLRANKEKFRNVNWHQGQFHSTSMPVTEAAQWILDIGLYYRDVFGIDYFELWRKVIALQLQIIDYVDVNGFAYTPVFIEMYNEMMRVRRQMTPKIHVTNTTSILFTLANCFDNWRAIGLKWILSQRKLLPELIFLIEIMNMVLQVYDDCFYSLHEATHVYYDSWNEDAIISLAIDSKFNFEKLQNKTCFNLNPKYYNDQLPVYLFFDWGGKVSFCLAAQFDYNQKMLFVLKEFYAMPGCENGMPKNLMNQVCTFFEPHQKKQIKFVRDTYGDDASNSIQTNKTINQDAIDTLKKAGWHVEALTHKYKEPPYHDKWVVMSKIFNENDKSVFGIRIDGNNCKYLVIALKRTKVKQDGDKLSKDKSDERKKDNFDQRKAPHSTDALDKGCYYLAKTAQKKSQCIDTVIR